MKTFKSLKIKPFSVKKKKRPVIETMKQVQK